MDWTYLLPPAFLIGATALAYAVGHGQGYRAGHDAGHDAGYRKGRADVFRDDYEFR